MKSIVELCAVLLAEYVFAVCKCKTEFSDAYYVNGRCLGLNIYKGCQNSYHQFNQEDKETPSFRNAVHNLVSHGKCVIVYECVRKESTANIIFIAILTKWCYEYCNTAILTALSWTHITSV